MSYTLPPWHVSKTADGIYIANVRGLNIIGDPRVTEGEPEDDAELIANAPLLVLQATALITAVETLADQTIPFRAAVSSLGLQVGVVRRTIERSTKMNLPRDGYGRIQLLSERVLSRISE